MDNLRGQVEKNKKVILPLCILVIILSSILIMIIISNYFKTIADDLTSGSDNEIELLPVQQRHNPIIEDANNTEASSNILEGINDIDPFMGPVVLTGVIVGGSGKNVAILEIANNTYVVSEGEVILDYWTIEEIGENFVVLNAEDRTHRVSLV